MTDTYTYGDSTWGDLLTAYNGQPIIYDGAGNPTSYLGWTMTWTQGRAMQTMTKSGASLNFVYDSDGLRTKKTYNGVTTTYYRNGATILHEQRSDGKSNRYSYGPDGKVIEASLGDQFAQYVYNAQGDVVMLLDDRGYVLVEYTYDAWGNITVAGDVALAKANPFTYRGGYGYYYDWETGLYYLQSRYYDPETCRFINADDSAVLQLDQQHLCQYNIFAYCLNNPVMGNDPTGMFSIPRWLIATALDMVFSAIGLSVVFYPVKAAARAAGKATIRNVLRQPIMSFLCGFGRVFYKKLKPFEWLVSKIPFVGGKWARKINISTLVDGISGAGASALTNNLLNIAVDNLSYFSPALLDTLDTLENEKQVIELQIKAEEDNLIANKLNEQEIIAAFRHAQEMYDNGTIPQKKQLINLYVKRINVFPEHVEIELNNIPGNQLKPFHITQTPPTEGGLHNIIKMTLTKQKSRQIIDGTGANVVEARGVEPLPCQEANEAESLDTSGFDWAYLPVISEDSKDVIDEVIYVGKAVLKEMWLEG